MLTFRTEQLMFRFKLTSFWLRAMHQPLSYPVTLMFRSSPDYNGPENLGTQIIIIIIINVL